MEEYQENSSPEKYDDEKFTKGKKSKNPRRFSDNQIRSLESIFKEDTKLEARKKAEVAKDLGLQPRQVAIWFQNKRARWKSRQIEQDYKLLRAKFNTLNTQFHDLKRENHSLQTQVLITYYYFLPYSNSMVFYFYSFSKCVVLSDIEFDMIRKNLNFMCSWMS